MRRTVIVLTAIALAFLAAFFGLVIGLVVEAAHWGASTSIAVLVVASTLGVQGGLTAGQGLGMVWSGLLALCLAPVATAAALGEAARLREPVFYAGTSGALMAALPSFASAAPAVPFRHALPGEGRLTLVLFLTGVGSGFLYWLIAGRRAGLP